MGTDVTTTIPLRANDGLCSPGVKLHGAGFIVTPAQAEHLGLGTRPGLDHHIREYRNGRDLTSRPRNVMVIDLFGLTADDVRTRFPEVYQHLLQTVKPERDTNNRDTYRDNWWIFGEPRRDLRPALIDQRRYIATVETAKHRIFQFIPAEIIPDNMLVAVGSDDAFTLGILSSRVHVTWALTSGATLEDRPRYSKSRCFDPFPFPAADDLQKHRIRTIAEHLDAHRKRVLADHPHLTLTGLYNILEKLRSGTNPADLAPPDRRIFDDGLVLILKEHHDRLDAEVAAAYGLPADLPDQDILSHLVALNHARAAEEAKGQIRWLRPDYQIPRFGTPTDKSQLALTGGNMHDLPAAAGSKPSFPTEGVAQTAAIMAALAFATTPLTPDALAASFKQGRKTLPRIQSTLAALARLGHLATIDGRTFTLRRAA